MSSMRNRKCSTMIAFNKTRVAISVDREILKEIKKKAVASEMTVSNFLVKSADTILKFDTKIIPIKQKYD